MFHYGRELAIAVVFLGILLLLALCAPAFYSPAYLLNQLVSNSSVLVAAIGMAMVILSRHIDISIGSQLSICGIAAGLLAKAGIPMALVVPSVVLLGAAMGAINAIFVALLELPSIVVTLATMVVFREALRWWREGEAVTNLPADFQWFGNGQLAGQIGIVAIAAITFFIFAWALAYSAAGRAVYATGSDPDAAWLVGVRPRRVVFFVFMLMGALTGLAALLIAVQFHNIDPKAGDGLELKVIAAVVVGGVSISGGRGVLWGVLVGVALLGVIGPALVFLGAQPYWEKALQGAIILISIAFDAINFQRRSHGAVAAH